MNPDERNEREQQHVLKDEQTVQNRGQLQRRIDPHDASEGQPEKDIRQIEEEQPE